jgi:hypothetical protein
VGDVRVDVRKTAEQGIGVPTSLHNHLNQVDHVERSVQPALISRYVQHRLQCATILLFVHIILVKVNIKTTSTDTEGQLQCFMDRVARYTALSSIVLLWRSKKPDKHAIKWTCPKAKQKRLKGE